MIDRRISNLIIDIVKDLENTRDIFYGYSYVMTMRNILIGKEDAIIAPNFKEKYYYGVIDKLTLHELEELMDELVKENLLCVIYSKKGKKLYCTHEYYKELCEKK